MLEGRAEALDESVPVNWGGYAQPPRRPALQGEEGADEEAQHRGEQAGIPGEAEAQREGEGERALAVRRPRQHPLDEVNRGVLRPANA